MSLIDLFRPDWKSSNLAVRKKSLLQQNDVTIVSEALNSEEDQDIINAVIDNHSTIESLELLHAQVKDSLKSLISPKLHKLYLDSALKADSAENITFTRFNSKQLSKLAREAKSQSVQLSAVDSIDSNENESLSSVIHNSEKKVAQQALQKLNDRETLKQLIKSARHKGTRLLVRKRYDVLYGEVEKAEAKRDQALKSLALILKDLNDMAERPNWRGLNENFEHQRSRWHDLSEYVTEDLLEPYNKVAEKCIQRQAEFQKEEDIKMAAQKVIDARVKKRTETLQELLSGAETLQLSGTALQDDLKANWELIGDCEDSAEKDLDRRFQNALKSFDAKQEILRDLAAKEMEAKEKLDALSISLNQLNDEESDGVFERNFKRLSQDFFKTSSTVKGKHPELISSISTAIDSLQKKSDLLKEQQEVRSTELRQQYKNILEEVQSFKRTSKESTTKVKELQKTWKELDSLPNKESEKIDGQFRQACDSYFDKVKEYVEERDWSEFANLSAKEKLILDLEALADLKDPQELAKKIKEYQAEWKNIGQVPHANTDAIWQKFKRTADKLYEPCKVYYDELDAKRKQSLEIKQTIVAQAEALVDSENWDGTAKKLQDLQTQWKAAGSAPRKDEKELWQSFRKACDIFFAKRKENSALADAKRKINSEKKEALISQIQATLLLENKREAAEKIKQLQKDWKEIGPAERNKDNRLWTQFRKSADQFFAARKEQYQQLQSSFDEFAQQKKAFIDKLDNEVTALSEETDWNTLSQTFKQAQSQLARIESAGYDQDKKLQQQLKDICLRFFKARDEHYDKLSDVDRENLEKKEEFCLKVEILAESSEWRETAEELKKYQADFKELDSINEKYDVLMFKRFNGICQSFFERRREHFEERDEVRAENLKAKEALCRKLEELAGLDPEPANSSENDNVMDLAAQLQDAFNNNSGGFAETKAKGPSFRETGQEVRELQAAWKVIGSVPKEKSQKIWERFRKAADTFYEKRNRFFADRAKK